MSENPLNTLDEYEQRLRETLNTWSPQQRTAFAAALAERWLLAYQKFSVEENWGDAETLKRIVAAIWDHCRGNLIAPTDVASFRETINQNAPDTEEFDQRSAWTALHACVILGRALECCTTTDSADIVVKAALNGFQSALGDYPSDSAGQRRAWKKVAARLEFSKQAALLECLGAVERFDDQSMATLREGLGLKESRRSERAKTPSKRKRVDDDSIDGWRVAVRGYLKKSPVHRIVFAAALAERLLPLYQTYGTVIGKGRPELLRGVLDIVWQTAAAGQPIGADAFKAHYETLQLAALETRDAEAWNAWSAWRVVDLAFACCGSQDNTEPAEEAAVVAYERVAGPEARNDPQMWQDQHRLPEVHNEIMQQMMLLMKLQTMPVLDVQSIELLSRKR